MSDKDKGNKVIIKKLNREFPSDNRIARFKHEHRLTNKFNLRDVIKALDFIAKDKTYLIVLEDICAVSLDKILKQRKIDVDEFLNLSIKITEILRDIQVEIDIESKQEINLDFEKIYIVIANLIHKAIKFSGAGSSIKITSIDVDNGIELHVIDSGSGIAEDKKDEIFNLYSKLSGNSFINRSGIGLGLVICKKVVDLTSRQNKR